MFRNRKKQRKRNKERSFLHLTEFPYDLDSLKYELLHNMAIVLDIHVLLRRQSMPPCFRVYTWQLFVFP